MLEAALWGLLTSGSLLLGAGLALASKVPHKIIGFIMAFGIGALISSVCFELVEDAYAESQNILAVAGGLLLGATVYFGGDMLISKFGGKNRKNMRGGDSQNVGLPVLLGTVLDGIPESFVIGMMAAGSSVSVAMIVAVAFSNIPEGLTSSTGLLAGNWKKRLLMGMWVIVIAVSVIASAIGHAVASDISITVKAIILSFAGGAILTMLANTMIPEAYRDSGRLTGLIVVLGFCLAFAVRIL